MSLLLGLFYYVNLIKILPLDSSDCTRLKNQKYMRWTDSQAQAKTHTQPRKITLKQKTIFFPLTFHKHNEGVIWQNQLLLNLDRAHWRCCYVNHNKVGKITNDKALLWNVTTNPCFIFKAGLFCLLLRLAHPSLDACYQLNLFTLCLHWMKSIWNNEKRQFRGIKREFMDNSNR